jgi:phosphoribosylamine--glycine ligase
VWKLAQSSKVNKIYAAPGNAGTAQIAHNLDIGPTDTASLLQRAQKERIDLTVVGPESPLACGIVDEFQKQELPIFGPNREAARIESSKVFAKELMQKYSIPSAGSVTFTGYGQAKKYLMKQPLPVVIKADGLAAGKGVTVAETTEQALSTLSDIMKNRIFGTAGDMVIIEECLFGKEMSTFAFTDGNAVVPMPAACDYKRVGDSDRGPNTGGMGSYSPPYFYNQTLARIVSETVMKPTVTALRREGKLYQGVLYGGLMITSDGSKVLEFNARFGDPETQVTLPKLKTDLVDIMLAVVNKKLDQVKVEWNDYACVGVVMASGGYPGSYQTGFPITGLDSLDTDVDVFHAGTRLESGKVVTDGGRVLTVVALGKTMARAREKVYANIARINFEGCHYRKDIAQVKEGQLCH